MIQKPVTKGQVKQWCSSYHVEFEEVIKEIKKNANFQQCLDSSDELYGVKHYNVLSLTPKKISSLYESVCNRVYMRSSEEHKDCWVSYELKIFVWLVICYLFNQISRPEVIEKQVWEKISRIFHNKNIQLLQYQAKLITCARTQPKKWEKQQELLLVQLMKSKQINSKWNQIAKIFYLKSDKNYFRNPKQIREHWLNHLNPQISKEPWNFTEDHSIIKNVIENGHKWALVAKLSGGKRTQHMVKNRYYALVRNQQKCSPSICDKQKILKVLLKKLESAAKIENNEIDPQLKQVKKEQEQGQCITQAKQQHKQQSFKNEEIKQKRQEIIEDDIMQIQYKNWQSRDYDNQKNLQIGQCQLLMIGHDESHEPIYQNDNFLFKE